MVFFVKLIYDGKVKEQGLIELDVFMCKKIVNCPIIAGVILCFVGCLLFNTSMNVPQRSWQCSFYKQAKNHRTGQDIHYTLTRKTLGDNVFKDVLDNMNF